MDFKKHLKILQETLDKYEITAENLREKRKSNKIEFPKQVNNRILDAFQSFATFDRAPIWMMRQAGRYLPEYMSIKAEFDFFATCQNPFIAAELTLQPIKQFEIDAAIIFSDILVLPKMMGMEIAMEDKKGPVIQNPLVQPNDIERLKMPDPETLEHVYDALFLVRLALQGKQALIGFCGGPWTVFSYMVEGGSSNLFSKAKKWLYLWNEQTIQVLDMLSMASADYLINQVKQGGAQVVQIFDSWAGKIPPIDYIEFIMPSLKKMFLKFKQSCPDTPIIMFAKDQNTNSVITEFLKMNFEGKPLVDGFQLDANVEEDVVMKIIEADRTLQGNMEPGVLLGNHQILKKRTNQMIEKFQVTRRYIVNLAHGLTPDHEVEKVKQFVQESQRQSKLFKVREVLE